MRSLLIKLFAFRFCNDLILLYPVYILLFQKHGITPFQISLLLMIWSGSALLFEIPTGVLADRFSRRNLLIIGRVFKSVAFIVWLGGTFSMYALGFILFSIGGSLMSGTFDAFVFDELKAIKREHMYTKVAGWMHSVGMAGVILSLFAGGFVAAVSYDYAFLASIFMPLVAAVILFSVKPVHKAISTEEKNYGVFLKAAIVKSFRDINLARYIFLLVVGLGAFGAAEEFLPLLFHDLGATESGVGVLFGLVFIFFMLGGVAVSWVPFVSRIPEVYLVFISGLAALSWGLFFHQPYSIGLFFICAFLLSIVEVRLVSKIQHTIESHERATILSIKSLLKEGFSIVVTLCIGFAIKAYTNVSLLWVMSGFLLFSSAVYILLREVKNRSGN